MTTRVGRAGALLACVLCLIACDADPQQSPRRRTLEGLIDHVILPLLGDLEDRAGELDARAHELCEQPRPSSLVLARDAWQRARTPLKQAEVLAFGPHTLSPWRLQGQLDFWPVRPGSIETTLEDDAPFVVGDDDRLLLGAAAKGMPAIEYLLYGPGVDAARFEDARRCAYLIALTADLERQARALREAWAGPFGQQLRIAAGDGTADGGMQRYDDIRESFGELVNSLSFTVEVVRTDKLGRPFGLTGGEPQPDALESRFAQRSIADAIDTLGGVEAIFTGRYDGRSRTGGIAGLLRERGQPQDLLFERHMAAASAALEAIDGPLERAIERDRDGVQAALDALRELQIFLQVELTQALAVTVTFGGSDGD